MIAAIKNSELPIATVVEGKAMSCGAVLMTFGKEGMRFADRNSTIMIHDVSSMDWGKVEEIKASAKEADRLNEKIHHMMAKNCGKPNSYFLKIADEKKHADWFLNSKEAKQHNIVNHIRVPKFKVKISVDIEFK